jgi:predicted transport protein
MALGTETDRALKAAFHDLRELKVDVAYPFLLELYDDYRNQILSKEDFLQAVRLVESYVFRRAICSIPTNSLNKTFGTFSRGLKKDRYLESIKANFLLLKSYRRFPLDEEFKREMQIRDLYNYSRRSYWLRRLENFKRKELVELNEYTVEHIMPQNSNLSQAWKAELGDEWERIHENWLHTLGNLTLTCYNAEYSDRPFTEKRDMPNGFRVSPLNLNQGLRQLDVWNEAAIMARAEVLSDLATSVWRAPELSTDVLDAYNPRSETKTDYSIDDHPYLLVGPSRELFEKLRNKVLSLDPVVNEEFLKLYVAYKAETNFVDVIPLSKRLRLTLNMPFSDIVDPRGLCRDVSNLGRWGNGDVEVLLSSLDELPYVMGLIRQSFERQMDNGGSE